MYVGVCVFPGAVMLGLFMVIIFRIVYLKDIFVNSEFVADVLVYFFICVCVLYRCISRMTYQGDTGETGNGPAF